VIIVPRSSGRPRADIRTLMDRTLWARFVLSFGGFLGIGDKLYAVPWNAVMIDRDMRTVFVDVKKETRVNYNNNHEP